MALLMIRHSVTEMSTVADIYTARTMYEAKACLSAFKHWFVLSCNLNAPENFQHQDHNYETKKPNFVGLRLVL